jgi:hypothetical protein
LPSSSISDGTRRGADDRGVDQDRPGAGVVEESLQPAVLEDQHQQAEDGAEVEEVHDQRLDRQDRVRRRAAAAGAGALDPTAILICGPGADTASAVNLVHKIREIGVVAPLYGFHASGLIGAAVPSAGEAPSAVTGILNADLRRRASQAFV